MEKKTSIVIFVNYKLYDNKKLVYLGDKNCSASLEILLTSVIRIAKEFNTLPKLEFVTYNSISYKKSQKSKGKGIEVITANNELKTYDIDNKDYVAMYVIDKRFNKSLYENNKIKLITYIPHSYNQPLWDMISDVIANTVPSYQNLSGNKISHNMMDTVCILSVMLGMSQKSIPVLIDNSNTNKHIYTASNLVQVVYDIHKDMINLFCSLDSRKTLSAEKAFCSMVSKICNHLANSCDNDLLNKEIIKKANNKKFLSDFFNSILILDKDRIHIAYDMFTDILLMMTDLSKFIKENKDKDTIVYNVSDEALPYREYWSPHMCPSLRKHVWNMYWNLGSDIKLKAKLYNLAYNNFISDTTKSKRVFLSFTVTDDIYIRYEISSPIARIDTTIKHITLDVANV